MLQIGSKVTIEMACFAVDGVPANTVNIGGTEVERTNPQALVEIHGFQCNRFAEKAKELLLIGRFLNAKTHLEWHGREGELVYFRLEHIVAEHD